MRKILIVVSSVIIVISFVIVSLMSYDFGMNYGVNNAESIRKSRITDSLIHETIIKSVLVTEVINSNFQNEIKSSGRVSSLINITISSEVNGKLEGDFSIKKGENFNKGDILFSIKNTDIKLLLEAKKSRFMSLLSANLSDIKLDYPSEYIKWDNYFNSISLNLDIPIFPESKSSKEKNFIISRGILTDYLSIKSEEERLKKYTVVANFDGIISNSYTDKGANVNMGSPIIDIVKNGNMEVELTVNTSEINQIKIGNKVTFIEGENKFSGKIIRKGRFVNEKTQSVSVFSELSKDIDLLYSGMYLEASITSEITKNVISIPRRSVFSENNVFIVNSKNKLLVKEINIVSESGDNVFVDNIDNNTLVVIEPLINTKAGTIVNSIIK